MNWKFPAILFLLLCGALMAEITLPAEIDVDLIVGETEAYAGGEEGSEEDSQRVASSCHHSVSGAREAFQLEPPELQTRVRGQGRDLIKTYCRLMV